MIVKLLLLVALAFSLGQVRDVEQVADPTPWLEVSAFEVEPEAEETITVERTVQRAIAPQVQTLAELFSLPPCSLDEGGVFRPPRILVA